MVYMEFPASLPEADTTSRGMVAMGEVGACVAV